MLDGFTETRFTHEGEERIVFRRGEGPAVLVMHEIPGVTPLVAAFARRVADAGFHVALPVLFGTLNKPPSPPYIMGQMIRACINREFHVLAAHGSSPLTDWLRALARTLHQERGGRGVGAIGMCITGNFALALMLEPFLMAPVLSQPSLPLALTCERRAALHISPEQLAAAKARTQEGARILGLRFTHDPYVPAARFETLRREFGAAFEGIEIDSGPGNGHGIRRLAHSVLTEDLVDVAGHPTRIALDRVLAFFGEQLQ